MLCEEHLQNFLKIVDASAGTAVFLSIVIAHVIIKRRNIIQSLTPSVSDIWIYPIKSCKGFSVKSAKITKRGLEHDRMMMVVDSKGKFISQRSHPSLSLVRTQMAKNGKLLISAENMSDLSIPLSSVTTGPLIEVTVWGDICESFEIIEGSYWFREYLNINGLKLVRMVESFTRFTDATYSPDGETSFSDGYPFLLTSQASLDDVNKYLSKSITMERFRPNIVLEGGVAYAEDSWKTIVFKGKDLKGDIVMSIVKPCSRCTIPNIDPDTGKKDEENPPMKIMKTFRNGKAIGLQKESWQKEVFFGQNVDHSGREGGVIEVGAIVVGVQ